jgi:antitoxin FitA
METTVVQVRNVPVQVVAALKAKAEARGQSLHAYVRGLLSHDAAMPSIGEVMATIGTREPVDYTLDDLRTFKDDGRR